MPSYRRPGVYFEETVTQAEAITGASLTAAAFLAAHYRGPTLPQYITSWSQFLTYFGGFSADPTEYLPFAVYQFFANGGREVYVARVPGSGAVVSTATLNDRSPGIAEIQRVTITGAPIGGTFTLTLGAIGTTAAIDFDATAAEVQTALQAVAGIGTAATAIGGPLPATPVDVTFAGALAGNQPQMTAVSSLTGGTTPAVAITTTTPGVAGVSTLRVDAANPGIWGGGSGQVAGRDGLYIDITDAGTDRFNLIVKLGGTSDANIVERWIDLSMDPSDGRYALSLINSPIAGSPYIRVADLGSASAAPLDRPAVQSNAALAAGTAGAAVGAGDLTTALALLDSVDRPLTLNLPGHSGSAVGAAISYAAARGDVFVVADPPQNATPDATPGTGVVAVAAGYGASSYGAVYYPWLQMADPATQSPGAMRVLPPGGSVIGQFAATDTTRGVFKTPAGVTTRIAGAIAVERRLTGAELDTLNPAGVNAIRQLPGAGIVIMGGRTLKPTGTDKYVAARRTLIYLRSSLINSTRFAIFEPNDGRLWSTLRAIIERFLLDFWQSGGLRGESADQAFYVKCDDENNTEQTIGSGEVRIEIGVALQYPAEFIVFKLSQREVGATVTIAA